MGAFLSIEDDISEESLKDESLNDESNKKETSELIDEPLVKSGGKSVSNKKKNANQKENK